MRYFRDAFRTRQENTFVSLHNKPCYAASASEGSLEPCGRKTPYLRHSSTRLVSLLHVAPVSSCQRVFQTVRDDSGFNGQFQVEVFSPIDELLSVNPNLLQKVLKHPEVRENEDSQCHRLLRRGNMSLTSCEEEDLSNASGRSSAFLQRTCIPAQPSTDCSLILPMMSSRPPHIHQQTHH